MLTFPATVGERWEMEGEKLMSGCSTDVLVSFPESLHIYSGLLTVSTVCGGLTGILAAALLYFFCLKPLLLTRQVSNTTHDLSAPLRWTYNILSLGVRCLVSSHLRVTLRGDCWSPRMGSWWITTKVTVSATAGRRLRVGRPMIR